MLGERRLRLRRRRGLLRRLRRGDRDPHDGRRDAPGARPRRRWASWRRPAATRCSPARIRTTRTSSRGRTRCSRTPRPTPSASGRAGTRRAIAERRLWVIGGDGAMYDIGFQSLSRMVARAGTSRSSCSTRRSTRTPAGRRPPPAFSGQITKLSVFGKGSAGKHERRKELGRILMAHGEVYVAQTTPAHVNHFYRCDPGGQRVPGPAVIIALHDLPAGARHRRRRRQAGAAGGRFAGLPAVHLRPAARRPRPTAVAEGQPRRRGLDDELRPATPIDFLTFARTEGRFAPHFAADGRRPGDPRPRDRPGSPTGTRSRSWPGVRPSDQAPPVLVSSETA